MCDTISIMRLELTRRVRSVGRLARRTEACDQVLAGEHDSIGGE